MSARDWRWRHGKRWDVGSCPLPPTKCRWFGATRRGAGRIHRTLGFLSLICIFAWSFDPWFVGRFCFSFLSGASLAEFKTGSLTLRLEPSLNSLRNRIISCFMRIYRCAGDCKRLQVTASDCKWLQVIASDCKWLQVCWNTLRFINHQVMEACLQTLCAGHVHIWEIDLVWVTLATV